MRSFIEKKKLLIFDFDGTIADTSSLHEKSFNLALSPWGIQVDYASIAGLRTLDAFDKVFSMSGLKATDHVMECLTLEKQANVRMLMRQSLQALPGVDWFLRSVRAEHPMAIYSSGSKETVNLALDILGYQEWFAPVICSDHVVKAKPNPEGYLKVLDITSVLARDALVFEDSDSGIKAALSAGIQVIDVRLYSFQDFIP